MSQTKITLIDTLIISGSLIGILATTGAYMIPVLLYRKIREEILQKIEEHRPDKEIGSNTKRDYTTEIYNSRYHKISHKENIHKYNKAFDSIANNDREIIKAGNTYTGVYKDQYETPTYIYLDETGIKGEYIPLKRHTPAGTEKPQTEKVELTYQRPLDTEHRIATEKDSYTASEETARHINEIVAASNGEAEIVTIENQLTGIINPKPKWRH